MAGYRITPEKKEEILAKVNIADVISPYVELKKKGGRLWGCCPFHGEKTPSFAVQPQKGMYYCFGCHTGGNAITFVESYFNYPFADACKYLADLCGVVLEEGELDPREQQLRNYRKRLREACGDAAAFFQETLKGPDGGPGRAYLKKRGLFLQQEGQSQSPMERFEIGYAVDSWDSLLKHLTEKGYNQQDLFDAGLLNKNENRNSFYDVYRNRVTFPIRDEYGHVLAFGARVLNDDKPKYLNTGDTPIYNKGKHLYGLTLVKQNFQELLVVEGYMDVIGLYKYGVENAVASLGTALTTDQAKLLKRRTSLVYMAYDGDEAGQKGIERSLDILEREGIEVRVIVFPDNLDPDEFMAQRGRDAFDALKEHAYSANGYRLLQMSRKADLSNENEREAFAIRACGFIESLKPIERHRFYGVLSQMTGYSVEELELQGKTMGPDPGRNQQTGANTLRKQPLRQISGEKPREQEKDSVIKARAALLHAMLLSQDAAVYACCEDAESPIMDAGIYRDLFDAIVSVYSQEMKPEPASLLAEFCSDRYTKAETGIVAGVLQEESGLGEDPVKYAKDCVARLRRFCLDERVAGLKEKLKDSSLSAEERNAVLQQLQQMKK